MPAAAASQFSCFQRLLLPGLAFKAVVIGGGYSTGRELAEFFLGSGPRGGLLAMLLAMVLWSVVCAVAFLFARAAQAYDYRSFFGALLGRGWWLFEVVYLAFLVLILAVLAAAAGAIGAALFDWPVGVGTLVLIAAIAGIASFGNRGAEQLFRYASVFIYLTYALFLCLALSRFGDRLGPALALEASGAGWVRGGVTYASYNVVAVVAVLPFVRYFVRRRDALVAGLLAGPLAMLPAVLFFLCMVAWYPDIGTEALPSDYLLRQLGLPWFQVLFQVMIFCALLETGVGVSNAFNERMRHAFRSYLRAEPSHTDRLGLSAALLICSAFVAVRIGLVDLIAQGYGAFGYVMLLLFVLPLLLIGTVRLVRGTVSRPVPAP